MLNQVVLVGRLTKDVEVQELENGKKRTSAILAVPRSYKNSEGIYETDFIHLTLWNAIASNVQEYCKTGDLLGIKGRIQSSNYVDSEGNKKYSLDIVAEKVSFLSSKKPDVLESDELEEN